MFNSATKFGVLVFASIAAVTASLVPPANADSSCSSGSSKNVAYAPEPRKDIVDTAIEAGSFKSLVAAVQKAGLVETLKGKGPFTVFAPTDEAFAKVPKATLDALLNDKSKLTQVLTYHVVAGSVMAKDVVKLKSAKTVNGQPLSISATKTGVRVGNAKVVKTDISASNGVIHVIDTVLLPKFK